MNRDIPLVASYSHQAVRALTAKIRAAVNRAPRDATVQPDASGLHSVPAQTGRTVENDKLGGRIEAALLAPLGGRSVTVPRDDGQAEGDDGAARDEVPRLHRRRPQQRSG